ncbi:MAG: immunity 17 family protein [Firmicutes bacterium]|nr:immunity 17 family protein [Bacillota bacterium]
MGWKIFAWLLPLLIGMYCILAAVKNWDFFFNNHRARLFVTLMGRNGARVFYGVLGVFIMVLGYAYLIMDFFG